MHFYDLQAASAASNQRNSAEKMCSLLAQYAAKSFKPLLAECPACTYRLPCALVEEVIRQDCLFTGEDERLVLEYVLKWGMRRVGRVQVPCGAEAAAGGGLGFETSDSESCNEGGEGGEGSPAPPVTTEAATTALAEADRLLHRVRLPFVPLPRLAALGRKRRRFASLLPSFRALTKEAVAVQLAAAAAPPRCTATAAVAVPGAAAAAARAAPVAGSSAIQTVANAVAAASGASGRAARRARYGPIPALDPEHVADLL
jgi:hypothetical protein